MSPAGEPSGFFRNNGLSIAMLGLFAFSAVGQIAAGFRVHNDELTDLGARALSLGGYLSSGAFAEAIFENWRANSCKWRCSSC